MSLQFIQDHFVYWFFIILLMVGLYGAVGKNNLVKKLIGLSIFQTAIILFYVSLGDKKGATIPIVYVTPHQTEAVFKAQDYLNPIPHVLMLTAIVVGVATVGVALALVERIHEHYGTIEEDEIMQRIAQEP